MNLEIVFPKNGKKITSLTAIGLLVLSALLPAMMVSAVTPPTLGGDYGSIDGVLGTDTYTLYPWDESSVNVGFSKYGELINPVDGVGLEYKGIDVLANPVVPQSEWNNGWLMDIHWVDNGCLQNVWAYALYSDWTATGVDGAWRQNQLSYDASAPGDTHGGRRTSGWATSDPIQIIYDGPRKAIYLLRTHIYDKAPGEPGGCELVELTIQLVFDKVQKDVMEIKDIKRICGPDKVVGPLQIEFSQRGEWDLGDTALNNPKTYAEFYNNLKTSYDTHPFYPTDKDVTYDLCQMLNTETDIVAYAAFWPQLTSKWVDRVVDIQKVDMFGLADRLTSLETYSHEVTVPADPETNHPWVKFFKLDGDNVKKTTIFLPYPPETYPIGMGDMTNVPWVFVWDPTNSCWQQLQKGNDWKWVTVPTEDLPAGITVDKAVQLQFPMPLTYDKEYLVLYKMEAMGKEKHTNIAPLECTSPCIFENEDYKPSYGMLHEPGVPFVIGEWDFELDFDHVENSTHQFRCVSVYGVTDLNNAVDPDQGIMTPGEDSKKGFRIDSEVQYQLAKTFNPIDLKDAAEKDTFRWAQKGDLTSTITLAAHKTDKYGNEYVDCPLHTLWVPSKWGAYCNDSEKVILFDSAGVVEPLLLTRATHYTIGGAPWTIVLNTGAIPSYSTYDYYKVLYTTKVVCTQTSLHDGRYEWLLVGETSHASDSVGAAMLGVAYTDWKDVEVWISALDIESESYGPSIPEALRRFATMNHNRMDYQYDHEEDDRLAFRDDWSTPEDWDMQTTINPYAVSSSNIIVVGGPINNAAASYWNDFTDALVFTNYGTGFYAPGCWARTSQPSLSTLSLRGMDMDELQKDELWYNSSTTDDRYGYAIVSVYKDLNETVGLVVYGYTAEDTYYTCYALRGGLLEWFQTLNCGVTTVVLEIDYDSLHPVTFHVKECLGPFTETTGFDTNFKTAEYFKEFTAAIAAVTDDAKSRELCYKLVDIEWCSQVHPDP